MEFVYEIEVAKQGELKKVLEADPYADDSFSRLGYTLKDSAAVAMPSGKTILYFKCEEQAKGTTLAARLKAVEGLAEVTGENKQKVISVIHAEEDNAAAGFGSIFG